MWPLRQRKATHSEGAKKSLWGLQGGCMDCGALGSCHMPLPARGEGLKGLKGRGEPHKRGVTFLLASPLNCLETDHRQPTPPQPGPRPPEGTPHLTSRLYISALAQSRPSMDIWQKKGTLTSPSTPCSPVMALEGADGGRLGAADSPGIWPILSRLGRKPF